MPIPFKDIDWNGHFKNGVEAPKNLNEDFETFTAVFPNRTPQELFRRIFHNRCPYCLVESMQIDENGKIIEPCPNPTGDISVEFDLDVPSGQLVVANDLRDWFPIGDDEGGDLNRIAGCNETTKAYAQKGLAHGFVGNSCPGVYRTRKGYLIANPPRRWSYDYKQNKRVKADKLEPFRHRRVAGICTDLWWYSLCDYEELQRRATISGIKVNKGLTILEVRPGRYHFKHWFGTSDAVPNGKPTIYAEITWVKSST